MLKKVLIFVLVCTMLLCLVGCGGGEKTLHCDRCNTEIKVDADSNMDESWIIFCEDCAQYASSVE